MELDSWGRARHVAAKKKRTADNAVLAKA